MRENFGIKEVENVGEMRKVRLATGAVSVGRGKLSYAGGMNSGCSGVLPKLDVTGSTPVARSKLLRINWLSLSDSELVSLTTN
jgi:hypothetical protein